VLCSIAISRVELDGHCAFDPETVSACGMKVQRTPGADGLLRQWKRQRRRRRRSDHRRGSKVARWFGGGNPTQKVGEELFINPAVDTYDACKAAVQMENFGSNWPQCKTGVVLTGLGFTGSGKAVGIGVRTAEGLAAARAEAAGKKVGTAQSVSTCYTFVGLADQVASEEERDTAGTWKVSKSYAYGASGENLSLVDFPVNTTTSKKTYYGVNPHGDVETLTDATTGQTTSTYRNTAYGQPDKVGTTGEDAITGTPSDDADVVNPYRFNSKRSTAPPAPTTWASANTTPA
jgi:hypothetical protein